MVDWGLQGAKLRCSRRRTTHQEEVQDERDQITREASFESLDVDSLDLVDVGQVIEEQFGVELKGDDMKNVGTVGEVVRLVVERAS